MRTAFKEWAVIVDALGRGEQILILRKGGISEGRNGFQVDYPRFLFFPTLFHQQRESVLPPAQARFDTIAPQLPPKDRLRLEYWADVVWWQRLDSLAAAERLRGQHVWRDEVIADRFEWGRDKTIHALAVRVHRLPHPIELPVLESYGGCKSWIELAVDVDPQGPPVLDEAAFQEKLAQFRAALETVPAA
ncbi:MAG: DUF1802 family protein [Verrucomicrobiota bacterium]